MCSTPKLWKYVIVSSFTYKATQSVGIGLCLSPISSFRYILIKVNYVLPILCYFWLFLWINIFIQSPALITPSSTRITSLTKNKFPNKLHLMYLRNPREIHTEKSTSLFLYFILNYFSGSFMQCFRVFKKFSYFDYILYFSVWYY